MLRSYAQQSTKHTYSSLPVKSHFKTDYIYMPFWNTWDRVIILRGGEQNAIGFKDLLPESFDDSRIGTIYFQVGIHERQWRYVDILNLHSRHRFFRQVDRWITPKVNKLIYYNLTLFCKLIIYTGTKKTFVVRAFPEGSRESSDSDRLLHHRSCLHFLWLELHNLLTEE